MGDGCGLPRRPGRRSRGTAHAPRGAPTNEAAADLLGDVELAARKRSRPGDGITRPTVLWSASLEQSKHPLRAVRRPCCHEPSLSSAQRLRRTHAKTLPLVPHCLAPSRGRSSRSSRPDRAAVERAPEGSGDVHRAHVPCFAEVRMVTSTGQRPTWAGRFPWATAGPRASQLPPCASHPRCWGSAARSAWFEPAGVRAAARAAGLALLDRQRRRDRPIDFFEALEPLPRTALTRGRSASGDGWVGCHASHGVDFGQAGRLLTDRGRGCTA